jgi:hypothetical protein
MALALPVATTTLECCFWAPPEKRFWADTPIFVIVRFVFVKKYVRPLFWPISKTPIEQKPLSAFFDEKKSDV